MQQTDQQLSANNITHMWATLCKEMPEQLLESSHAWRHMPSATSTARVCPDTRLSSPAPNQVGVASERWTKHQHIRSLNSAETEALPLKLTVSTGQPSSSDNSSHTHSRKITTEQQLTQPCSQRNRICDIVTLPLDQNRCTAWPLLSFW